MVNNDRFVLNEQNIQKNVNEALISANMNPSIPFDVMRMARQLGFAIRDFHTIPANIIGFMFLRMDKKMSQMVKSDKLIGLNVSSDLAHKRFAVAHEIGHYIMHYDLCLDKDNPVFFQTKDDENGIEAEACKFAAMLLMDAKKFSEEYNRINTNENLDEVNIIRVLSQLFQAPQTSVRRRIHELNLYGQ